MECFVTDLGRYCLGDARKLIGELSDRSVDVIITDPPWGVGFDEYDDLEVFFELEDEMFRVLKDDSWLVFFFTPKHVLELTRLRKFEYVWMMPYLFWPYGTLSRNPIGGQAGYSVVMVFRKGKPKIVTSRRDVLLADEIPVLAEGKIKERQFKPTYTVQVLVTMFTKEGDLVLDPFAGYGSIPLVCELYGRRWLAFEIDPVKYAVARKIITERKVYNISKLRSTLMRNRA